ncbi:unnamed protein product, partial [Ectocarpus fasciculatus]
RRRWRRRRDVPGQQQPEHGSAARGTHEPRLHEQHGHAGTPTGWLVAPHAPGHDGALRHAGPRRRAGGGGGCRPAGRGLPRGAAGSRRLRHDAPQQLYEHDERRRRRPTPTSRRHGAPAASGGARRKGR